MVEWRGSWPSQLTSEEASGFRFDALPDLIPTDERPFLLPLRPLDERAPLTFGGLDRFARQLASSAAVGAISGGRCALALSNGPELAAAFLVLTRLGVAVAPLNPDLGVDEAEFELSDLPAATLILPAGGARAGSGAREAARRLGLPLFELTADTSTVGLFQLQPVANSEDNDSAAPPSPAAPAVSALGLGRPCRETIALVMHTSGTTRRPKLVPLAHGQLCVGSICVASTLRLPRSAVRAARPPRNRPRNRPRCRPRCGCRVSRLPHVTSAWRPQLSVNLMPLFHLHGLMINVLVTAVCGASVLCAPSFDAPGFFACLAASHGADALEAADSAGAGEEVGGWGAAGGPATRLPSAPTWYSAVPTIHAEVARHAEQVATSRPRICHVSATYLPCGGHVTAM